MKTKIDDLARFGGPPLFASPRPIGQLAVPSVEKYVSLLAEPLAERRLTNDGPLAHRLEQRLATHHAVPHCVSVANAGLALMMLLQSLTRGRRGEVIMPAFSYRGLPHFARWAGQTPRFCDVDPRSHFLDLDGVAAAIGPETTAILGVCNVHDHGDVAGLGRLARRHGLPLILDAVYAMHDRPGVGLPGSEADAEVYSLHVTKLLAGFEGGYVLTRCPRLAESLIWQRNFTLPAQRPAGSEAELDAVLGLNAKLNEFHAAMALAALDDLPATIARNRRRFAAYEHGLRGIGGLRLLPYGDPSTANFQLAIVSLEPPWPLPRDLTVDLLRAEGMAISGYYSPPLHRQEERPEIRLPVAEALAQRHLQLPVGELVDEVDVAAVCGCLRFIAAQGSEIARRLHATGSP